MSEPLCKACQTNTISLNGELWSIYRSLCLDCYSKSIALDARQRCLLLDHQARRDLRQIIKKGYINRTHQKKYGVMLLMLLGLIERTRESKTMYRYEATAIGIEASKLLPSFEAEWNCTMAQQALVYGDGTVVAYGDEPSYGKVADYHKLVDKYRSTE